MQPKISVIIPAYNNASFLHEAIGCVLNQAYDNLEIIVVNDGSTDDTESVIKQLKTKIHYYYIAHSGAGAAQNYGVQQATGDYLAFLDADDIWPAGKLQQQMDCLSNTQSDAVFTTIMQRLEPSMGDKKIKQTREVLSGLCASTLLIKKHVFLEIGFFNTHYLLGEFIEWFMRAKQYGLRFHILDEIITTRRIHGKNTSLTHKMHKKDYLAIIIDKLKREQEYAATQC